MCFFCENRRNFTVITYNATLVSKEIIENIEFFFEVNNIICPAVVAVEYKEFFIIQKGF